MTDQPTPQAPAQDRVILDEVSRQAREIEALGDSVQDLNDRLTLYERRLDALAQWLKDGSYVL